MGKGHSFRHGRHSRKSAFFVNQKYTIETYNDMIKLLKNHKQTHTIDKEKLSYYFYYYTKHIKEFLNYEETGKRFALLLSAIETYYDSQFVNDVYSYIYNVLLKYDQGYDIDRSSLFKITIPSMIKTLELHVIYWKSQNIITMYLTLKHSVYILQLEPLVNSTNMRTRLRNNVCKVQDKDYVKYIAYFVFYSRNYDGARLYRNLLISDGLKEEILI